MPQITDQTQLLTQIGGYAFAPTTDAELSLRLQTAVGSAVDRLFTSLEALYAFRDRLGVDGMELLGQVAGYIAMHGWADPTDPNRVEGIRLGVLRDAGAEGTYPTVDEDPEPRTAYRSDGLSWKANLSPTLELVQALRWEEVKRIREERSNATAQTPVGTVQIDPVSKQNINGLVTGAMLANSQGAPFSADFTLADNSVVTLDAAGAIGLGLAVLDQVSRVYARARELRDLIYAMDATVEAVQAIDVGANWP